MSKFGGDFGLYTADDDKAITSRQIGRTKNLDDVSIGRMIDRTPGAVRQRRYVLNTGRKRSR